MKESFKQNLLALPGNELDHSLGDTKAANVLVVYGDYENAASVAAHRILSDTAHLQYKFEKERLIFMAQENVETIKQMYQAASKQDMPKALDALDESLIIYEQESLPYGGRYEGHEGFQKLFQNLAATWDEFKFTPKDFMDAGETVVAVIQLTGKAKSTGTAFDMTMYELWKMREGRAVECRSILWDTAKVLEILGERK